MSTEIVETEKLILTRFYGGDKRGVCYQLNILDEDTSSWYYVTFERREFENLLTAIRKGVMYTKLK